MQMKMGWEVSGPSKEETEKREVCQVRYDKFSNIQYIIFKYQSCLYIHRFEYNLLSRALSKCL